MHVKMVLLKDRLDGFGYLLDELFTDPCHLLLECDLLVPTLELLIELLFVHFGFLCLGLLLADLHLAVVIVKFYILLHCRLEVLQELLDLGRKTQVEVGLQLLKITDSVLTRLVLVFELKFNLLLHHRRSLL